MTDEYAKMDHTLRSAQIEDKIQDYIMHECQPGDKLPNEFALAERFETSRSTIREVMKSLAMRGMVEIRHGSATVAMTMAAGIVAAMPAIQGLSPLYLACTTAAVADGATVLSHFNDSGFWLVKSLIGLDEKTTLKTWTIMETLVGGVGFIVALIISMFA